MTSITIAGICWCPSEKGIHRRGKGKFYKAFGEALGLTITCCNTNTQ